MSRFDFSSFYLNTTLSDVVIVIRCKNDYGDVQVEELPSHGIVLANVSQLFKRQIELQSKQHALGNPAIITLDCTADQVSAARAMVKYIYKGSLPITTQQTLLVNMLHISRKFQVTDCASACLSALMAIPQLQLDTVHLVLSLLPADAANSSAAAAAAAAATDSLDLQPLINYALDHLQRQLGDLEATFNSSQLLHGLQRLPHSALLGLLQDERTSAASENTVLAAVQSWLSHQPAAAVDVTQQQQLAAAIRIPLLEPTYLTTVLPRIPWLLNILGPQGLAMAAGAARGLFDPHAEPCLSNPRACGAMAADWLKGPRQLPATSTRHHSNDGPKVCINWSLPLEEIQKAFEEACAAAAAGGNTFEAAAAAAGSRVASPVPLEPALAAAGSLRYGGATPPPAAAVAAATVQHGIGCEGAAVAAPLRRTSSTVAAAAVSAAAAAVAFGAHMLRRKRTYAATVDDQAQQHKDQQCGTQQHALTKTQGIEAELAPSSKRQCRRNENSTGFDECLPGGLGRRPQPASAQGLGSQQPLQPAHVKPVKLRSQEVQFAGYSWQLVLYFQAQQHRKPQQQQQQEQVSLTGAGAAQQQQRQQRPRASGGSQLTPGRSRRTSKHCSQAAAADVAAAAAMQLPDDVSRPHPNPPPPTECGWMWQARLAIEAAPCLALEPGVSVAAFSGSLAVLLNTEGVDTTKSNRGKGRKVAAADGKPERSSKRQSLQGKVPDGLSARQALATVAAAGGRMSAGVAAGGTRAVRSSSTLLDSGWHAAAATEAGGGPAGVPRSPMVRRAAAVAAAAKIDQQQFDLSICESDAADEVDSGNDNDVQCLQGTDGLCQDDPAGEHGAEDGGRSMLCSSSSAFSGDRSAEDAEGDEPDVVAGGCGTLAGSSVARKKRGAADAAEQLQGDAQGDCDSPNSSWQEFQLPQGSWVKSSKCDTGFRNFFGVSLVQEQWNEAAWGRYLQPGGVLQLRGRIWNVR